jgi:NAD(P)-dependent dehydrogenase (short-subunit alcohol dehydrogenase family)
MAANLAGRGIEAAGFAGDVLDPPSLTAALAAAVGRFGQIDVLEYSPAPHEAPPDLATVDVLQVTAENVQPQVEYYVHGCECRKPAPPAADVLRIAVSSVPRPGCRGGHVLVRPEVG